MSETSLPNSISGDDVNDRTSQSRKESLTKFHKSQTPPEHTEDRSIKPPFKQNSIGAVSDPGFRAEKVNAQSPTVDQDDDDDDSRRVKLSGEMVDKVSGNARDNSGDFDDKIAGIRDYMKGVFRDENLKDGEANGDDDVRRGSAKLFHNNDSELKYKKHEFVKTENINARMALIENSTDNEEAVGGGDVGNSGKPEASGKNQRTRGESSPGIYESGGGELLVAEECVLKCQHSAVCRNSSEGHHFCDCRPMFTGQLCQFSVYG